jgi:protein involved in polysaccharide export with SLBB domain
MLKRRISLFVLPLLAITLYAQDQSSGGAISGNSQEQYGPVDCTDPLSSGSSQCIQQNQRPGVGAQPRNENISPGALPSGPVTYRDNASPTVQGLNRNQSLRTTVQPELLTEFQKFVASSTGQVLPIYGADLFRNVPSTFAPLDMTPVPLDYLIGPGDELRVRVWGQVNFNADLRVDRAGEIYLPQVGQIHVAGLQFSSLDQHLRESIGRIYRNFDLTADVGQIRAIQVYVAGTARRAGVYTVSSLSTLVDALFASGGPSVEGSIRHIQLKRNGTVVTDFDLYALLVQGDKSKDVKLLSGDVIFIPPAGPQIAVAGSVRNPAIYELLAGETIGSAIKDAGGASTVASDARVSIDRIADHRDRQAMEVAMDTAGLATPLVGGDILRVLSIVARYQKTVTLRGNAANTGHFAWHAGMHLSDLIPDRDALISRDYWWKRAQLGLPSLEFEPVPAFSSMRQPSAPVDLRRQLQQPQPQLQQLQQPYGQRGANISQDGSIVGEDLTNEYGLYSTGQQSVQQSGQYGQVGQQPGQLPGQQPLYNPNSLQANQRAANSSLAAQQAQLQTQNAPGQPERTDVRISAPEIDWNYAVIERLDRETLKTSLIPFDLGKLVMLHDRSQDLELQPGDVVSVFSQADIHVPLAEQTKYVRLEGEFIHSGIYSVKPGEKLRELVQQAGGFSTNAYLYGSEFTRETTRIVQQARIDEYVQNLQLQVTRGNLALAASPVSSAQDLASGSATLASGRELITKLSQIRATGRVVLEFNAVSAGQDIVPDIDLEDGDRFVVPPVPATVNVVGAVYDQNSFLYRKERPSGAYLHLAGGPSRDADKKHAFIIRADGSVVSTQSANGLWGNTFEQLKMNPGDTIVVPEKTYNRSALRGFLDWSQLFSQLALGVASIAVIAKQ